MAISANLVRGSFGFGLEGDMARAGRWLIGGPLVGFPAGSSNSEAAAGATTGNSLRRQQRTPRASASGPSISLWKKE